MKQSLILRNREYKKFQGKALWVWLLLLLSYILFFIWMYWWDDTKGSYLFVMPIFFFVRVVFLYFDIKKQKIEISDSGIKHVTGYGLFSRNYSPDWEVSWVQVQRAFLNRSKNDLNNPFTPLHIFLKNKDILKLTPSQWVDPLEAKPKMSPHNLFNLVFRRKRLYASIVKNNPLLQAFADRGLLTEEFGDNSEWTDITADPLVMTLVLVFLFLISYHLYEMFSGLSETYAGIPPYFWIFGAGGVVAFWCYWFIKKTQLKHGEKIIVAGLLGIGVSLASYPFLMRINQWTDTTGIQTYQYKLTAKGVWIPQNKILQLPNISFGYKAEIYWNQFETNSLKEFQIRRGGLGIYQLDMEPIRKDWKDFYEGDQGYYARRARSEKNLR